MLEELGQQALVEMEELIQGVVAGVVHMASVVVLVDLEL